MTSLREYRAMASWHLGRARYFFVHIPKNAGVSMRKAPELNWKLISADPYFHVSRAYTDAVRRQMQDDGEHHGLQHARWRDINPKVTAQLTSVAVVRNPWSRVVSRWRFGQLAVQRGTVPADYVPDTLEGFLEQRHIFGGRPYYWHRPVRGWYPQADYVCDPEGNLRCDILRFEALSTEFTAYFGTKTAARKRNVTHRDRDEDYRAAYTSQTMQIVAEWFAEDIALFGFDFDGAATRNTAFPAASTSTPDLQPGHMPI